MEHHDPTLEAALIERLHDVTHALDDTVRLIESMQGTLELGRRELERGKARLREMSPGILIESRHR